MTVGFDQMLTLVTGENENPGHQETIALMSLRSRSRLEASEYLGQVDATRHIGSHAPGVAFLLRGRSANNSGCQHP